MRSLQAVPDRLTVKRLAVRGNLITLKHPAVADDTRYSEAIVSEDTASAFGLRAAVLFGLRYHEADPEK